MMHRLFLPAAPLLILTLLPVHTWSYHHEPRRPCIELASLDLEWHATYLERQRTLRSRARKLVVVPVIIHLMLGKNEANNTEVLKTIRPLKKILSTQWVTGDFASVNATWDAADIEFELRHIEACDYTQSVQLASLTIPSNTETRLRDLRRSRLVNARFNRRGFVGIAIHVWPGLSRPYGFSFWSCLAGSGAVWFSAGDVPSGITYVGGIVAHEIGHVLGLPHNCVDRADEWPDFALPICDRSTLMASNDTGTGVAGRELLDEEKLAAWNRARTLDRTAAPR